MLFNPETIKSFDRIPCGRCMIAKNIAVFILQTLRNGFDLKAAMAKTSYSMQKKKKRIWDSYENYIILK